MFYATKDPKLFPAEQRDLEDEDKRERNALKLQAVVLEDDAAAEVRRKMLGKVISKGKFMFHCDKKYNSSFPSFKAFRKKKFKMLLMLSCMLDSYLF